MPHTAEITIKSGADTVSFVPADYQITYDSLAGKDSGRSADGHMHISWILRSITKIEITLPPHELSSILFTRVLGLVQGQEYKITYYDYLEHRWVSEMDVYTSTTSAGYSYKGIVNDVSFEAIAMMGLTSVPHFNPTVGTISTAVSPTGAGSVTGGGTYALGATATLTAIPATGYTFSQWNGGSTANPRTVTVTGDMFFTATFSAIPTYTISASVSPGGAGTVSGAGTYSEGSTCTLSVTPAEGYTFTQWNDGDQNNPRTFTVTGDATYTATLTAIPSYTITASVSPSGAGTVTGAGTYYQGETCTLTVTSTEGYEFSQWNDGNTSNPRTITVVDNATFTASLVRDVNNYFYVLPVNNGTLAYVTKYTNRTPPTATKTVQYSTDKTNWSNLTSTPVSITAGQKMYLMSSTSDAFYLSDSNGAIATGIQVQNSNYSIGGDISTLFNGASTLPIRALAYFLNSETNLTSASSLLFSTVSLNEACFERMFNDCTSLTSPPALPATQVFYMSYAYMFNGCTALTTAPALPASPNVSSCYIYMFWGCTSLVTPPALPNEGAVAVNAYGSMFYGCTSLTSIPQLSATTLNDRCYRYMFNSSGVTLVTTPSSANKNILRIPMVGNATVGTNSLQNMFNITPSANTVYFANGTSPYYSIYWASSPSYGDENWDVMGSSINVDFYCDGVLYNQIYCSPDGGLDYINTVTGVTLTACDYQTGWVSQQYRAIYYTSEMSFGSSDWADFLLANDMLYSL